MEKQTVDREKLYWATLPEGEEIKIYIDPYAVADKPLEDGELWECARALSNNRAAGTSYTQAEHIKEWLHGAESNDDPDIPPAEGAEENWWLFIRMVRAVWRMGQIP